MFKWFAPLWLCLHQYIPLGQFLETEGWSALSHSGLIKTVTFRRDTIDGEIIPEEIAIEMSDEFDIDAEPEEPEPSNVATPQRKRADLPAAAASTPAAASSKRVVEPQTGSASGSGSRKRRCAFYSPPRNNRAAGSHCRCSEPLCPSQVDLRLRAPMHSEEPRPWVDLRLRFDYHLCHYTGNIDVCLDAKLPLQWQRQELCDRLRELTQPHCRANPSPYAMHGCCAVTWHKKHRCMLLRAKSHAHATEIVTYLREHYMCKDLSQLDAWWSLGYASQHL